MKSLKHIIILLGLLTLWGNEAKSQIDTTFWFAAPWVSPDHNGNTPMAFRISTFANPTTVRIRIPERLPTPFDTTFSVAANTIVSFDMTPYVNDIESKPADNILNTGIHINTDFPITVIYEFISLSNLNPETYSLKGSNGYGTEFVTPFQTLWNNQPYPNQPISQFSVVATEDNTTIYITPRCPIVGHPVGVTYSVLLPRKGNVYTVQNVTRLSSVPGQNLSGSIVVSNKPVAVTVSDDSVNPSGGGGCHDLMGDQIVPTDVIGKEYIINKGFLNAGSNESIFVVATENFTSVTIDNGLATTTVLLNQGETYNYSITENLTHVIADKNVYLIHMSGYGCELGEAILPPLNCSGSDQVSFTRTNGQQFLLNLLCRAGDEGSFILNGSAAWVTAAMFSPVPGTGGAWVGTQVDLSTTAVPVGTASFINNTSGLFSMGVINGGASTGCLYHYLSSFLRRVYTNAGNDTTLCNGNPSVALNGTVEGGATTGIWTVLNGTGTLNSPNNLNTTYNPSTSDYAAGTVTFVLASTGNCVPVTDTMRVDFALGRYMAPRGRGSIVTVGSNAAGVPRHAMAAYAASKAAAHMFTRCLGLELGPLGIRCNIVAPGSTLTPMQTGMWADHSGAGRVIAGQPEAFKAGIPLGKLATPEDIAEAVAFLLSDRAAHITMADLYVDGGATLRA